MVSVKVEEGNVFVECFFDVKDYRVKYGFYRLLVNNMIKGVFIGWIK